MSAAAKARCRRAGRAGASERISCAEGFGRSERSRRSSDRLLLKSDTSLPPLKNDLITRTTGVRASSLQGLDQAVKGIVTRVLLPWASTAITRITYVWPGTRRFFGMRSCTGIARGTSIT